MVDFRKIPYPLRLAAAFVYRGGFLLLRKTVYRPKAPLKSPVVIVGSFLAGGAGKTPFTIHLAKRFSAAGRRVAILCHSAAWDEFRLISAKVPEATVYKTRNRYATAKRIDGNFDVILCDGGLEDTRFAGSNVTVYVLRWNERVQRIGDLIPAGMCVSLEKDHPEAKTLICTECRDESGRVDTSTIRVPNETGNSSTSPVQDASTFSFHFDISRIQNGLGEVLPQGAKVSVVVGIGNPERFCRDVSRYGAYVARKKFLPDHFKGYALALAKELSRGLPVVITEKDAARLSNTAKKSPQLYVAEQEFC